MTGLRRAWLCLVAGFRTFDLNPSATDRLVADLKAQAWDDLMRPLADQGLLTDSTTAAADCARDGRPTPTNP